MKRTKGKNSVLSLRCFTVILCILELLSRVLEAWLDLRNKGLSTRARLRRAQDANRRRLMHRTFTAWCKYCGVVSWCRKIPSLASLHHSRCPVGGRNQREARSSPIERCSRPKRKGHQQMSGPSVAALTSALHCTDLPRVA